MPQSFIVAARSIKEYFEEAVISAVQQQSIHPNEATVHYLVELLCQFAKSSAANLSQPLAPLLVRAKTSALEQSVGTLQKVGDQSLYVTGFFAESLKRQDLDQDYYQTLGQTAYLRLSQILEGIGNETRLIIVFSELGDEFSEFVQVLRNVKEQSEGFQTVPNFETAYEDWLKTGNKQAEQHLKKAGFFFLKHPKIKQ